MFSRLGMTEILLILAALLLIFGAKRFPDIMDSLGKGVKKFRDGQNGITSNDESSDKNSKS